MSRSRIDRSASIAAVTRTAMMCAAVMCAAGCKAPAKSKVPGASLTPPLTQRLAKLHPSAIACGDDVSLDGAPSPDIAYRYTYDELGRLTRATGTYAAGGADDQIDYTYDYIGHLTHMLQTRGWGDDRVEITANYDTLGDLLQYTTQQDAVDYHDLLTYSYSAFGDTGQPMAEVMSDTNQPDVSYQLDYDSDGRLAVVVQDGAQITTYTYDDDARTTTIDTDNGAFVGVIEVDDQNREISEVWGGSDPSAIASVYTYDYDDDRLLAAVYRSGSTTAPQQLTTFETDALLYTCATPALAK